MSIIWTITISTQKNWFFPKLFKPVSGLYLKNCVRCKEFLPTKKEKAHHDFLKHYNEGKEISFEEKPLDIIRYPALTVYKIEYKNYSQFYPFYDSEKCVTEFLFNVKQRFYVSNTKWFKCSFKIENQQSPINSNHESLKDIRYWTTESYESVYFNDFVFYSLKSSILKRVIHNQASGSAWYFNRFLNLAVKISNGEAELIK